MISVLCFLPALWKTYSGSHLVSFSSTRKHTRLLSAGIRTCRRSQRIHTEVLKAVVVPDVEVSSLLYGAAISISLTLGLSTLVVAQIRKTRKKASFLSEHEKRVIAITKSVYGDSASTDLHDYLNRKGLAQEATLKELGTAKNREMTYGELDLAFFVRLVRSANPLPGESFLDIGSGSARLVGCAALLCPDAATVRGVEILQALNDEAIMRMEKLEAAVLKEQPQLAMAKWKLECRDYREVSIEDVSLVWCYATTWEGRGPYLRELSEFLGNHLPVGSRVIVVDKRLAVTGDSFSFELIKTITAPNRDTGKSVGYVYRKIA